MLLTFVLMFAAIAVQATTYYNLWINGVGVTDANNYNLSVINGVTGTAYYVPSTNILVLNNATMTVANARNIDNNIKGLKISVTGTCTLNVTSGEYASLSTVTATIGGSGTLICKSVQNPGCVIQSDKILTIQEGVQADFRGTYGLYGKSGTAQRVLA